MRKRAPRNLPNGIQPTHRKNVPVPLALRQAVIAFTRDQHGSSRTKAAKALGISVLVYDHVVSANGRANSRALEKLMQLLGVDAGECK